MKISIRKGIGFGLTSGVITTLGIITGLNSTTGSKNIVIGGILTIAIADAFSDALGVHISEESGHKGVKDNDIWSSTFSTFFTKFFVALTFLIPIFIFNNLQAAIIFSIIYGLILISIFSYYISKKHDSSPYHAILQHLVIAIIVIFLTSNIKTVINLFLGN